jgi:hypothetical protein
MSVDRPSCQSGGWFEQKILGRPLQSGSQAGPIAAAVADAVGGFQPSADSGPSSGVAAPVGALRRLHVRASDQGFLPVQVEHYVMLLDWTGRELLAAFV